MGGGQSARKNVSVRHCTLFQGWLPSHPRLEAAYGTLTKTHVPTTTDLLGQNFKDLGNWCLNKISYTCKVLFKANNKTSMEKSKDIQVKWKAKKVSVVTIMKSVRRSNASSLGPLDFRLAHLMVEGAHCNCGSSVSFHKSYFWQLAHEILPVTTWTTLAVVRTCKQDRKQSLVRACDTAQCKGDAEKRPDRPRGVSKK